MIQNKKQDKKSIVAKNILILGGTSSIGQAIADLFQNENVNLNMQYFHDEECKISLEKKIKSANFYKCDLTDEKQVNAMIISVLAKGNIDVVITSVSAPLKFDLFLEKNYSDFSRHFEIQLKGLIIILKKVIPEMKKKRSGKIINILSEVVVGKAPERMSDYTAAKYALLGFSKSLSSELLRYNIAVNCVSPGLMKTKLTSAVPEKMFEITANQNQTKKLTTPLDVAKIIKYLCSKEAETITGENIIVSEFSR